MKKWFNKQSRLVQVILLIIPLVNWIVEIIIRWEEFLNKGGILRLLFALLVTIGFGLVLWLIDIIWIILFKHLIFAKGK